jgi:threonine/homoserine/homoserine lactone efflux protein
MNSTREMVEMVDVLALATYTLIMSITPGPNNVMLAASGANFGFRRTLPHMLGVSFGFAGQAILVCTGLGMVFNRVPQIQAWLTWIGAIYLVYIGWKLLLAGSVGKAGGARPMSALEAVSFQFLNPKAWIAAITIAALFMPKTGDLYIAAVSMSVVLFTVNIPCVTVWAAFGSTMRRTLDSPARRTVFNVVMAGLLVGTALMMLRG